MQYFYISLCTPYKINCKTVFGGLGYHVKFAPSGLYLHLCAPLPVILPGN